MFNRAQFWVGQILATLVKHTRGLFGSGWFRPSLACCHHLCPASLPLDSTECSQFTLVQLNAAKLKGAFDGTSWPSFHHNVRHSFYNCCLLGLPQYQLEFEFELELAKTKTKSGSCIEPATATVPKRQLAAKYKSDPRFV